VTRWHQDKRALVDLVSFLFDRLDDDEAVARALLTPTAVRRDANLIGPVRAHREVAAKRMMVEMWFDGVQADLGRSPVAGLDVADAMILALVVVYADHPLFDPAWLADVEQPDQQAGAGLDNVVPLRLCDHPGRRR
jgi:hypothetical protein